MQDTDRQSPPFANSTLTQLLVRYGGSLRIAPLLRHPGLTVEELCAVMNELAERLWIKVTFRRAPCPRLPERLRHVERITTTRFGRSRVPRHDRRPPAPYPGLRPRGRR